MKAFIGFLFGIAAMASALTPIAARAEAEKSWILVAILFSGNDVQNSKIFGGIPSEADCKQAKIDLAKEAKDAGVEVWPGCLEIVRDKNLGDPKTKQKS